VDKVIRILVANHPRLMRESILDTLADQPGIQIIGEVSDEAEIHGRVNETLPDLLFITLDEPGKRPVLCDTILREHPDVRIIAVASEKNRTVFYWSSLSIHSNEIEPSEQGILNAVRRLASVVEGSHLAH
jgi:DNA-binding NarL/FixJ family response regulator